MAGPNGHDPHDETPQPAPPQHPEDEKARDGQPDAAVESPRRERAPLHPQGGRALIALNRRQPPTPPAPPIPDALDPDRILELPVRWNAGRVEGTPANREPSEQRTGQSEQTGQEDQEDAVRSTPSAPRTIQHLRPVTTPHTGTSDARRLIALREAAQPYLAHLAARRAQSPTADVSARRTTEDALDPTVCPICHGAGFVRLDVSVGDKLFGQAVRCECKEREIEARERQKLRDLSSLKPFEKKTFETFETSLPSVAEAHAVARRYAADPNGWLIVQGGYGCGKTHLAAAIARTREEAGESVFFSIVPDLLDHLRATFAPASEITYDELFDRVRHVGLLVLDDLGSENSTAWATEKLFQIINYRYNYRLPTVITTNIRLLSHLDDRIRSRLSDLSLVRWIVIDAPDYRERHVGQGAGNRPPAGNPTRGRRR